ncbi:hypothetical protein GCM10023185_39380 [Hymenobacter saemangeumensis]|uniref:Uncharacterized protein n=1 Tax=Hymenobacter saemangeumensis TaxID=1084522 RepID=A0ABP8IQR4_9BACT
MGAQVVRRRVKHGHRIHLLAGKVGDLAQYTRLHLFERGDPEVIQERRPVAKAGFVIVAAPLDSSQPVVLLHIGAVGRSKSVDGEKPAAGFDEVV